MKDKYIQKDFSEIIQDKKTCESIFYIRNGNIVIFNTAFKGSLNDLKTVDVDGMINRLSSVYKNPHSSMQVDVDGMLNRLVNVLKNITRGGN